MTEKHTCQSATRIYYQKRSNQPDAFFRPLVQGIPTLHWDPLLPTRLRSAAIAAEVVSLTRLDDRGDW